MAKATKQKPPAGLVVQTIICSKDRFKTVGAAIRWVREHGFKVPSGGVNKGKVPVAKPGIDETSTSWRFRQRPPSDFQAGSMRTIRLTEGVSAVVGRLKRQAARKGADVCANSNRGEASQSQVAQDLLDLLP